MKSKSFNLKQKTPEGKLNKTFDFTAYYKTAAETNKVLENSNVTSGSTVSNKKETNHNSKRERSPKKKRNKLEPIDISIIDIEGSSLNSSGARGTPLNESKVTSTPQGSQKNQAPKVKSIMKNSLGQGEDDIMDESQYCASPAKPKKRNKSVSFLLEESEQVAMKKTKSNDSIENKPSKTKKADVPKEKIKKFKKLKSDFSEKENKDNGNVNMETVDVGKVSKDVNQSAKNSNTKQENPSKDLTVNNVQKETPTSSNLRKENQNKKRKLKKVKKQNSEESTETGTENNNNEEQVGNKHKKLKKKKLSAKPTQTVETEADGEPSSKTRKKDVKPEAIVENLENLSIGDNAHTLTNLLEDMTVAEKDKRKKNKRKIKKDKKQTGSTTSSENAESEKVEEEKVKWKRRKWNKDKKGDVDEDAIPNSVIVENLPFSMMCDYKKILSDHFGKHGIIKKIGIAELYPTEESKPVFTTTINFYSDGAASKALEENNTIFEGSRIRVRQPLPTTQITLVVRSYAELTDQALSTTFLPAGKIRNIRHLVKGKKAIATAFIEFDGPEALEKALKLGQESKIAGKKMHVSRFEVRKKKKKTSANSENERDSENSD